MAGGKMAWLRKKMMKTGGKEEGQGSANYRKFAAFSSALRRWRKCRRSPSSDPFILRALFDRFIFSLLYAAEGVVLVASLCFFYLRFGFRL
ncbi:hypothetical protein KSP40_PGU008931 [Platanthera guangdongensis]|uniref:Uncharacterized protein n=1 Tax=Platanthera guangdongensis TaxID=2320717 RepID=A0ABR2LCX7_9ASPA